MSNISTPRTKTPPDAKRYYTPAEVEAHNAPYDLWLSWNGHVYDLSVLAEERRGDPLLVPILKNAEGRFLHVPPPLPRADWDVYQVKTPWWQDKEAYCIGKLGSKTRKIIIKNTLTQDEHTIEVCVEEKLSAIQDRYMALNSHAKGYMWKRLGTLLDMTVTLEENGIKDEGPMMEKLGMDEENYLPTIHLYFSDDLTVA
ncbi:hypothetical protein BCR33DRAFT_782431 [Rhizoclosmatium globosum]|uniref:Cytochrome b5 heme-binding domain-containing protein n=1 Tax=Rhizoclosmatium globosum TaxID=329046 RepID=A0A1Y2CP65_9FUNG|nr:hypothetical protein BCR33DRAFT_782431 [Rhizoclosmatium globosum]|eukprot:ORY48746.1 hypothetical protein BCR33DRAFT_782431 [Rhizoclosmatium globosum]